jgi:multimeric flavodoxin WrbA
MRNILLINASPRKNGTSTVLLSMCKSLLEAAGHRTRVIHLYPAMKSPEELRIAVTRADTLVMSGPCYVNTYPAETTAFLDELSAHPEVLHGQSLFGMIQGGMPYYHTHEAGLLQLEIFCKRNKLVYNGGFVMGLGAMLNGKPISQLPNAKQVLCKLEIFFSHIEKDEVSEPEVYRKAQWKIPGILAGLMAVLMNKRINKDLRKRGIDPKQKSPYLIEEQSEHGKIRT